MAKSKRFKLNINRYYFDLMTKQAEFYGLPRNAYLVHLILLQEHHKFNDLVIKPIIDNNDVERIELPLNSVMKEKLRQQAEEYNVFINVYVCNLLLYRENFFNSLKEIA
jgi:hypothetical protein